MKILLIEPDFPIPAKSKNHKNFLPIGLLKLNDYYRSIGHKTKIVYGNKTKKQIGVRYTPDKVMITSLFTYWSEYVWNSVEHYRNNYPDAEIIIGGIYASLRSNTKEFKYKLEKYKAKFHIGLNNEAEEYSKNYKLDYSNLHNSENIDYQIIHASRGCPRHCKFCGTWKIEPEFTYKKSIKNEITKKKLVFYDNNLLLNPFIDELLDELIDMKKQKKILWCESQSGFDGRILISKPHLGNKLKKAGFRYPRIAWDGRYTEFESIKKQLDILTNNGFNKHDMYVFMIYNWDISFEEMEAKRIKCWDWKIQISDCRYRPLSQIYDNYNPRLKQTNDDYFIHRYWNDSLVKQFRRNVRRQNICIRQNVMFYSKKLERMKVNKEIFNKINKLDRENAINYMCKNGIDFWFPEIITKSDNNLIQLDINLFQQTTNYYNKTNLKLEKIEIV